MDEAAAAAVAAADGGILDPAVLSTHCDALAKGNAHLRVKVCKLGVSLPSPREACAFPLDATGELSVDRCAVLQREHDTLSAGLRLSEQLLRLREKHASLRQDNQALTEENASLLRENASLRASEEKPRSVCSGRSTANRTATANSSGFPPPAPVPSSVGSQANGSIVSTARASTSIGPSNRGWSVSSVVSRGDSPHSSRPSSVQPPGEGFGAACDEVGLSIVRPPRKFSRGCILDSSNRQNSVRNVRGQDGGADGGSKTHLGGASLTSGNPFASGTSLGTGALIENGGFVGNGGLVGGLRSRSTGKLTSLSGRGDGQVGGLGGDLRCSGGGHSAAGGGGLVGGGGRSLVGGGGGLVSGLREQDIANFDVHSRSRPSEDSFEISHSRENALRDVLRGMRF
eukprot:TRINITY_DN23118_c0_g1_i1.p1 TRINITY_DN23118_c0_g1~~TRINITY_DN23118_c0_g1_i1.p1  ORF type:complete len:450 (+),score=64.03 TRINITY_DN23118_c0_g1_i1:153-1352(+)